MKDSNELTFNDLISNYKIPSIKAFLTYLVAIWKDLSKRSTIKTNGINKITFSNYMNLPGLIDERLFNVLDTDKNNYLSLKEFTNGMVLLFTETFENLSNLIFRFYDFDNDSLISKEDIKVCLSYVPLETKRKIAYINKNYAKFQKELNDKIDEAFGNRNKINLNEYKDIVLHKCSDIFALIILYVYNNRPFTNDTIELFENASKINFKSEPKSEIINPRIVLPAVTFKYNSGMYNKFKFNLEKKQTFLNNYSGKDVKINEYNNNEGTIKTSNEQINIINNNNITQSTTEEPQTKSQNQNIVIKEQRRQSISISGANTLIGYKEEKFHKYFEQSTRKSCDKRNTTKLPKKTGKKMSKFIKKHSKKNLCQKKSGDSSPNDKEDKEDKSDENQDISSESFSDDDSFSLDEANKNKEKNQYIDQNKINEYSNEDSQSDNSSSNSVSEEEESEEEDDDYDDDILNQRIKNYESYIYRLSSDGKKLRKMFSKLISNDFYLFTNKTDNVYKEMHHLSGVFMKENQLIHYEGIPYYSFTLIFTNEEKTYFLNSEQDYEKWIIALRNCMHLKNIDDYYELLEKIGEGKFSSVFKAQNKKTKKIVAIKILNKNDFTSEDLELIKREIDIMTICHHPNIVKLIDKIENESYIYLITSFYTGGNLFSYLAKRNFKLKESRVKIIIKKICQGVKFIHNHGIVHRDLKPENIMLSTDDEDSDIKIVDFGISKILGPNEKCSQIFGTISYIAPEVLNLENYDYKIDVWSIGVICFYMLCGKLPFDDEDECEVIRQTRLEDVDFNKGDWSGVSEDGVNFVKMMLKKNPEERYNIDECLESKWICDN